MSTRFAILVCACCFWAAPVNSEETLRADLCVVEATPGGVACAVRAAREGLSVVLVNRTQHPGGILSSGLGVWDTVWEGKRSPIYDELRQAVFDSYRETYGEESSQYRHALPGESGHTNGKFEPRVIEGLIREMIEAEENITFLPGYIPVEVEREGRLLKSMLFQEFRGEKTKTVEALSFADCTYEGDVLPLAKVAYRVGRESREEFGEPHAGVVYMKSTKERPEEISDEEYEAHEALNFRSFSGFQEILFPESTGAGDGNVQAFNYRTILTDNPENRIPVTKPEDYDPEFLKTLEFTSIVRPIPNSKIGWNRPQIVGLHQEYVEGDWDTRQKVMDAHWDATMALLWFLQHDESVPEEKREHWLRYGLTKDEFPDNDHRPYEMYIREGRRLDGRYMLTQHDLAPVPGTLRAPAHPDAIAMTDWYADSHAVTKGGVRGSLDEGKMMLHAETWPGQIPWRCLLPKEVDNLIVPVCFSSTHVAWGAIRLEPTWMQTGEAAAYGVLLAKENGVMPGTLDSERLVRRLSKEGFLISFFNDVVVTKDDPLFAATQYFGTRGFFSDYVAALDAPLTEGIEKVWRTAVEGDADANEISVLVHEISRKKDASTGRARGEGLLELWNQLNQ
ncbi:MAG: pyridine nucleotide-disulfide oxidoreductase [Verrucomicrobiales bacterium]|nr:pyridine nucleotide-disulfide oxidoreductase [Verrucomicrobiales bacterium]